MFIECEGVPIFPYFVAESRLALNVFQHFLYKRIALETSSNRLKVSHLLRMVAVHAEARLAIEVELFLGIFVHHLVQFYHCVLPVVDALQNQIE